MTTEILFNQIINNSVFKALVEEYTVIAREDYIVISPKCEDRSAVLSDTIIAECMLIASAYNLMLFVRSYHGIPQIILNL